MSMILDSGDEKLNEGGELTQGGECPTDFAPPPDQELIHSDMANNIAAPGSRAGACDSWRRHARAVADAAEALSLAGPAQLPGRRALLTQTIGRMDRRIADYQGRLMTHLADHAGWPSEALAARMEVE